MHIYVVMFYEYTNIYTRPASSCLQVLVRNKLYIFMSIETATVTIHEMSSYFKMSKVIIMMIVIIRYISNIEEQLMVSPVQVNNA